MFAFGSERSSCQSPPRADSLFGVGLRIFSDSCDSNDTAFRIYLDAKTLGTTRSATIFYLELVAFLLGSQLPCSSLRKQRQLH